MDKLPIKLTSKTEKNPYERLMEKECYGAPIDKDPKEFSFPTPNAGCLDELVLMLTLSAPVAGAYEITLELSECLANQNPEAVEHVIPVMIDKDWQDTVIRHVLDKGAVFFIGKITRTEHDQDERPIYLTNFSADFQGSSTIRGGQRNA